MTPEEKLNEKLAKWAGFEYSPLKCDCAICRDSCWIEPNAGDYPNGTKIRCGLPNFTDSLDACFKWLVPKLGMVALHTHFEPLGPSMIPSGLWEVMVQDNPKDKLATMQYVVQAKEPALALCLAIEKLI